MTEDDLRLHLAKLNLPNSAIDYVVTAAKSPPALKVSSGPGKNLTGERSTALCTHLDDQGVPTLRRLQFGALSTEYAYLAILEYTGEALLVLDQPTTVTLSVLNRRGRRQRVPYTPDFLVVTDANVRIVQIKKRSGAEELVRDSPLRWTKVDQAFKDVAADAYFSEIGIEHVVVVDTDLPWNRVQNFELIRRRRDSGAHLTEAEGSRIRRWISRNSPVSVAELVDAMSFENADPVLMAIGQGLIFAPLDDALLSDSNSRVLCSTEEQARHIGGALASIQRLTTTAPGMAAPEIADPAHFDEIGYRLSVVRGTNPVAEGRKTPALRTVQRWRSAYAAGGVEALFPKWHLSGNRTARLSSDHVSYILETIKLAKSDPTIKTRTKAYQGYKDGWSERGSCEPVSYEWYCELWRRRKHNAEDAFGKGGRRLANAVAVHGNVDDQVPIATRPFQVAHVDHCLAPAFCYDTAKERKSKPWLTLLVDDFGPEPIACVMRFAQPSAEVDQLLLRVCARRHGRLPENIFSDGGSDFRSNEFIGCLAAFNVHWINRPPSNPRVGEPVERTFGTFAESVCKGNPGYTPDIINARALSASKHPSRGPARDFIDMCERTEHLLFDVLPNLPRADGAPTVAQARADHEKLYGRHGVPITIDRRLLVLTSHALVTNVSVEPSGSFRIGEDRYYCAELSGISDKLSKFRPRKDPEDPTVVHVFVRGVWTEAKSRLALKNRGRTDESIIADQATRVADKSAKKRRNEMLHRDGRAPTDGVQDEALREQPSEAPQDAGTADQIPHAVAPAKTLASIVPWLRGDRSQ
ncbi:hypothetical protein [Luteibacter sp. Lutesp34]|uniref:hypothetical protein n=1 Tax=Luteibacter sp. Lutesp34 TaxID=3243030 RepID=UPI0039B39EBE